MNKSILFSLLLLLIVNIAYSNVILKGWVKTPDLRPVEGASVIVDQTVLGSETDKEGYYFIAGLKKGKYLIKCSHIAFRGDSAMVDIGNQSELYQDFIIDSLFYELPVITKEGEADIITLNLIHKISREELKFERYDPIYVNLRPIEYTPKIGFWEKVFFNIRKVFNKELR